MSCVTYTYSDCSADVNYEELARCTDDFNGAQCKAVCVEAVSCFYLSATTRITNLRKRVSRRTVLFLVTTLR